MAVFLPFGIYPSYKSHPGSEKRELSQSGFKSQLYHVQTVKTHPSLSFPIYHLGLALPIDCAGLQNWYRMASESGYEAALEVVEQDGGPDAGILRCQGIFPSIHGRQHSDSNSSDKNSCMRRGAAPQDIWAG